MNNYESSRNKYPAGKFWSGPRDKPETYSLAWSVDLLPYLELATVYDLINFSAPLDHPTNLAATGQVLTVYLCPSTYRLEPLRGEDHRLLPLAGGLPGAGMACMDYLGISGPDKDAIHPDTGEEYGRQRGILIGTKGLPNDDNLIEPPPMKPKDVADGTSYTVCVTECAGRGVDIDNDEIDSLNGI
ncbi:hypothetical protein HG15A2_19350 [Adhaeretor mobilis]|uniref:DUF1559 domain-containing protein n=1 Tax=Adhaeretor mobilis TaxID=1930276 RepID=A0A517MUT8_9BACT|nr:hypothetical protein HG15A2_19350 [Adhaeretor mobilis]